MAVIKYNNGTEYVAVDKYVISPYDGINTVQSLTSVPVTRRLVMASNISSDQNLGLAAAMTGGCELHIIAQGTSGVTITFPATFIAANDVVKLSGDSISIGQEGYCEINIIYDGTKYYIRAL